MVTPLCLPRFLPHRSKADFQLHGFLGYSTRCALQLLRRLSPRQPTLRKRPQILHVVLRPRHYLPPQLRFRHETALKKARIITREYRTAPIKRLPITAGCIKHSPRYRRATRDSPALLEYFGGRAAQLVKPNLIAGTKSRPLAGHLTRIFHWFRMWRN
jgi:hypothetical protein